MTLDREAATKPEAAGRSRFMVRDVLSLDDLAMISIGYPNRLSASELRDVQAWFALRVRGWERTLLPEPAPTASGLDATVRSDETKGNL